MGDVPEKLLKLRALSWEWGWVRGVREGTEAGLAMFTSPYLELCDGLKSQHGLSSQCQPNSLLAGFGGFFLVSPWYSSSCFDATAPASVRKLVLDRLLIITWRTFWSGCLPLPPSSSVFSGGRLLVFLHFFKYCENFSNREPLIIWFFSVDYFGNF